jgi:hypothetical protein
MCIRYSSRPSIITHRDLFSLSPRDNLEYEDIDRLVESPRFRHAVAESETLAVQQSGSSWIPLGVRFLMITNPHEWSY